MHESVENPGCILLGMLCCAAVSQLYYFYSLHTRTNAPQFLHYDNRVIDSYRSTMVCYNYMYNYCEVWSFLSIHIYNSMGSSATFLRDFYGRGLVR